MSVSSCLLLFILCLSLHFCDCRILGSLEKKSEDRKFDISATSKVADNNNTTRYDHQHAIDAMHPLPDQSMNDEIFGAKLERNRADSSISLSRKTENIRDNKERKRSSSSNPKGSSPASISWHVRRHEKPSDKDTELFDSDYCPPKTHPPSHN